MKKADLHCHSFFSEHPSDWFLQKLGARESYTDPMFIYQEAHKRGMDFVTITDHNRIDGALMLKDKYPKDVFLGVESTAYFPEDNCKIHILIYGLNESQFELINHIRKDIYELRDFLKESNLTHSVAHASYSVNGKLSQQHLERLILLFDVFETINGGRNTQNNLGWKHILDRLNPDIISDMYAKHRIEPFSHDPWVKGYTGGSDDHAGIFIGTTYTQSRTQDIQSFLEAIKSKSSISIGRNNDFHALAFTVYKIAYDFSRHQGERKKDSLINTITESIFENRHFDLSDKIRAKTIKSMADLRGDELKLRLGELMQTLQGSKDMNVDIKLDKVYNHISDITDSFFKILLNSLEDDLQEMNLIKIIRNVSMSIPGIFLLLPFFSTVKHMHQTLDILSSFRQEYAIPEEERKRRTLWFSDTINDLNGVSVTLKQMGQIACNKGRELMIVSSLRDNEISSDIPENFLNLPFMYSFRLPFYESYQIKIPSILRSLKQIIEYSPDQIIISTPGPIGLLGLLIAKLLKIRSVGIYHTDFHSEAGHLIEDESASSLIMAYEKWFYSMMDEIRVPTREYGKILEERGIFAKKIGLLRRGIEIDDFEPKHDRKKHIRNKLGINDGVTLLYAGRVSQDKSLDLLCLIYLELLKSNDIINLIIAGNGPYLSEMKEVLSACPRAYFLGAVSRDRLPFIYNGADFFVFPSVTDTFGMVILESLACGLPSIVSNYGGPKELIGESGGGIIVPDQDIETWKQILSQSISLIDTSPDIYENMRVKARKSVEGSADWDAILDDLLGHDLVEN